MVSVDERVSRLLYPSRMERVVHELKLETVADVVKLRPATLLARRSFGRKTLCELGAALKNHLGHTWEEAHLAFGGQSFSATERSVLGDEPPPGLAEIQIAHVASLRKDLKALPKELRAMSVDDAFYPAVARVMKMQGPCRLVEDIAKLRILDSPQSGPFLSVARPAVDELRRDPLASHETWRSFLYTRLASIDRRWRRVLEARAGMTRRRRTLDEIATELGVTRQAVQQLEKRAVQRLARGPAPFAVRRRLCTAMEGQSQRDVKALRTRDPFFSVRASELNAFAFLVNRVLGGDVRVVQDGGRAIVVKTDAASRSSVHRRRLVPMNPASTASLKHSREEEVLCAAAAIVGLDRAIALLLADQRRMRRLLERGVSRSG